MTGTKCNGIALRSGKVGIENTSTSESPHLAHPDPGLEEHGDSNHLSNRRSWVGSESPDFPNENNLISNMRHVTACSLRPRSRSSHRQRRSCRLRILPQAPSTRPRRATRPSPPPTTPPSSSSPSTTNSTTLAIMSGFQRPVIPGLTVPVHPPRKILSQRVV
jgi:hypothetical protein